LKDYNFEEIVINSFKSHTFHFASINYLTRGAVETAYVGINNFNIQEDESIVFIDNDNIHVYPKTIQNNCSFIGYSIDYDKTNFSFIKIKDGYITEIQEKNKISDYYCCGIYGFKNANVFKSYAVKLLQSNIKSKNEFYFSTLYQFMIQNNERIVPLKMEKTYHLGSKTEIEKNEIFRSNNKLRVCFDLDNTLFTFPTVPDDYTTVKPIENNIKLLKYLKSNGHEIIIHTARRMRTHNNNIGKVLRDIAQITFNSLEQYNIPYDEIIFGKPIADIYIDDKALNPYINNIGYFGLFVGEEEKINELSINKYNTIVKQNDIVIKTGPEQFLNGEVYYYQNIPVEIRTFFPEFITYNKLDNYIEIKLSYVNGISLFYLYKNQLLTEHILNKLFDCINTIHQVKTVPIIITKENVKNNYIKKIQDRFNKNDYNEEDAETLLNDIISGIENHFSPCIVNVVHGDLWFSNIIMDYEDNLKFLDMRGSVDNILTLNGDIYYDYGKLYQSIIGLDLIIHGQSIVQYRDYITTMKDLFMQKCREKDLNIDYLRYITKSMIFGSIALLPESKYHVKKAMFQLIRDL
jgi:capsule biosynthesis phosphatase